jgi:hypothetical protein
MQVFGKVVAMVHVIEFQKRGLPHAHLLIILDHDSKIKNEIDIDSLISAEIPDPQKHKELHDLVIKHMIHGPCDINKQSPCLENKICIKNFPKRFQKETIANVNGYPLYRRRDGCEYNYGKVKINNRWVVPYNPWLLMKYQAHINVEICSSIKSEKYLYKYVFKGYDCANLELKSVDGSYEYNEVHTYMDSRYISAPESIWRLLEFKLHDQTHSVSRLDVHLPNSENVYFKPGKEKEAIEKAKNKRSTLTAWFELNKMPNSKSKNLFYFEIPNYYAFRNSKWIERRSVDNSVIGRMYLVNPNNQERYCLRLLLLHVKGAESYADLRTVNGFVHSSFESAAHFRGLIFDELENKKALDEAAYLKMPSQLRSLFAVCCIWLIKKKDVKDFFENYKLDLTED